MKNDSFYVLMQAIHPAGLFQLLPPSFQLMMCLARFWLFFFLLFLNWSKEKNSCFVFSLSLREKLSFFSMLEQKIILEMSNMKSSFKTSDQDIGTIFTCAICYFFISCRPSAPFCHKWRAKNAISARPV
jgi:hypothetical protein